MARIGMGQMKVEDSEPERNLRRAVGMIEEAGASGCDVLVLPECLDFGWTHPSARDRAQPLPGFNSDLLADAARKAGICVVAGLVERAGNRLYNAAVLLSPEGELLLKHRKINELDIALDLYSVGDRLSVAETSFGKVGVTICADNFPNSLCFGESLARMGARYLLSPCAWAVDADHDNAKEPYGGLWKEAYGKLTREYDLTVVGVSNVGGMTAGPWEGRKCIGCSLAMGPGGAILAEGPYGEEAESLVIFDA